MLLKHAPPSALSRRPAADLYVSQLWVMTPPASVRAVTRRACMEIVQIGLLLHNKLAMHTSFKWVTMALCLCGHIDQLH